jgi:hypothetical protein
MISVYGQGTMVSFSALLASRWLCSFTNRLGQDSIFRINTLGGLFYLIVSLIFFIRPNRYAELQIAECIKLTSKYLQLRGDLWERVRPKTITKKQLIYKYN